jgi:hypothetical protein
VKHAQLVGVIVLCTLLVPTVFAKNPTPKSLITDRTTEAERYRILAPYVYPSPGSITEIDVLTNINSGEKDPFFWSGSVEFRPPKGVCFTVTRTLETPDEVICKRRSLKFTVKQLNPQGRLLWRIKTGPDDFGNEYYWQTPHRIAQVIKNGERAPVMVPLDRCVAHRDAHTRRVILTTMAGEKWTINLPAVDKIAGTTEEAPNLYIANQPKSGGIDASSAVGKEEGAKGYDPLKDYEEPKPDDPVTKHWVISRRNSYVMESSNFKITDSPPGMHGECRYRFRGAIDDKDSGWMECHETDRYDVVLMPITCLSVLE